MIKIYVKTREKGILQIDINSLSSIEQFKYKIQKKEGTPIINQCLIYKGEYLEDNFFLKNYSLNNESTVLLFNKKKSLLLKSSNIFNHSTLIDRIRQSCIDLEIDTNEEQTLNLLTEAAFYLDKIFDLKTIKELFSLILTCFQHFPEQSLDIISDLFHKKSISNNLFLIMASVLSFLDIYHPEIQIQNFEWFISKLQKEILPQIKKKKKSKIILYDQEVDPLFQTDLIIDIALLSELTEEKVLIFYPKILHSNLFSKINLFIQKVSKVNLLKIIPETEFLKDDLYLSFNPENMGSFLSISTEQTFRKILPKIESKIIQKVQFLPFISGPIIEKCIEFDISVKSMTTLFNHFTNIELVLKNLNYLNKYDIQLPDNFVSKITTFPKSLLLLKVISHVENLPEDILSFLLSEAEDIESYIYAFKSNNVTSPVLSTLDFWKHILNVISNTSRDKISKGLLMQLAYYLEMNIPLQKFDEFYDHLIFDNFPPNQIQSSFLFYLFNYLKIEYRYELLEENRNEQRIERFFNQKIIPDHILYRLFNFRKLYDKNKIANAYQLYAFLVYDYSCFIYNLPKIEFNLNEESIDFVTKFIKSKCSFNLLKNIVNESTLSFIVNSVIFGSIRFKVNEFVGINKENVLPIFAIGFMANFEFYFRISNISFEYYEILIESLDFLLDDNVPQIYIESINSILLYYNPLFDKIDTHFDLLFKFFTKLIDFVLEDKTKINRIRLLGLLLFSTVQIFNGGHKFILLITQKYGVSLLKFIFKYKKEIIHEHIIDKSFMPSLYLDVFDEKTVINFLVNEIQTLNYDDVDLTIRFLIDVCEKVPILKFTDFKNLKMTFQKLLEEEKWSNLDKFVKFTQKILKFEEIIKIDDFIRHILNDPELENHQFLFDILFKLFMKDSCIAKKYATLILERCTTDIKINPTFFLEKASYIYKEFQEIFDRVFNQLYAFFSKDNNYDYRILIVRKIYKPLNYSVPGIDCTFINKLINEKSFQSFLCLYKIASYFPFLFERQFDSIINSVLPIFNYLHLLFDQLNDENLNNIKVFYSAFSFLVSCLYSADFFSTFCYWLFDNFTKLSNEQVICMSSILFSLFHSDYVNKSVLSLAYKYNFLEIVIELLGRKIEGEQLRISYFENITKLTKCYISYFYNVSKFATFIFFDMVKNGSIKNPFELEFNSFSATPLGWDVEIVLNIPSLKNSSEKVKDFIKSVNEKHPFMILNLYNDYPTNNELTKFLGNFKNIEVEYEKTRENPIPYLLTIKMLRYLCLQPQWVFNYFNNYYAFARLPEHNEYLEEVATIIRRMNIRKNKYDELCPRDFDPNKYFTSEIFHDSLPKFLMKEIETEDEIDDYLYDLISLLVVNEKNMISFLHYISDYLVLIESKLSFKMFKRLNCVINSIIKSNTEMSKYFFVICGNKYIHIALSPFFRFDESTMFDLATTLCLIGKNLPIRTTQIVGFICTLHPSLTYKAMTLYDKLTDDKAILSFKLIKNVFESEKHKEMPNYYVIRSFFEKNPSLIKNEIPFLLNLVPKYINRYITENYLNDELFDMICLLINFLAPERKDDKESNYHSIKDDSFILYPPPDNLIQTSKDFWLNIYEKNRSFLIEMIKKNELNFDKFNFLHEFHELVSFKIRFSYFRRRAKEMLNLNDYINIKVNRPTIIQDTFECFSKYKPKDLLRNYYVKFENEYGIDAGGLTREWFSYLIKELFNPDFGLFIKCGNESYFPSSLSYINNNNHIDYFKFTGQIIGLALIRNQCVNAHLSIPFIRQILHQDIVFKDLEDFDEPLMKSLQMILDVDDVKELDLFFSIDDDQFGKIISTDLIKNGSKIAVTNSNRNEYVNLYADYKLRKSVIKQISSFCDGFDEIVPPKLIQMFSPSELNLMICGIPKININDMKMFTHYINPYNKDHPVIQMFFKMLTKWSHENLAKLLLFITGSSQVPVNGFKDFQDTGNPICISPGGEKDRLPAAHTCSNMLCLPNYDDENDMNNKLLMAIQHCEFGFI